MKNIKQLANNQIVVCEGNYQQYKYEFFSYGTLIATYYGNIEDVEKLILTTYYDYSKTTSKWLKIFLNDYCNVYYKDTNELRKLIKQGGCGNVNIVLNKEC